MAEPAVDPKAAYETARKDLITALTKKRAVDKSLAVLETQLYAFEGSYLTETASAGGNIIQGFEAYLKPTGASKKRHEVTDADRMFSNSSYTVQRSLELQQGPPTPPAVDFSSGPVTVSLPAQSQSEISGSGNGAGPNGSYQTPSASSSRKDRKRSRRENTRGATATSGDEDDAGSVVAVATTRSRPGKRVRTEG